MIKLFLRKNRKKNLLKCLAIFLCMFSSQVFYILGKDFSCRLISSWILNEICGICCFMTMSIANLFFITRVFEKEFTKSSFLSSVVILELVLALLASIPITYIAYEIYCHVDDFWFYWGLLQVISVLSLRFFSRWWSIRVLNNIALDFIKDKFNRKARYLTFSYTFEGSILSILGILIGSSSIIATDLDNSILALRKILDGTPFSFLSYFFAVIGTLASATLMSYAVGWSFIQLYAYIRIIKQNYNRIDSLYKTLLPNSLTLIAIILAFISTAAQMELAAIPLNKKDIGIFFTISIMIGYFSLFFWSLDITFKKVYSIIISKNNRN